MSAVTIVAVGDTPGRVIDALADMGGAVSVARRCPELSGLLAACQSGLARVAVVADFAEDLTATLVDRLAAVGVGVVAVAADANQAARLRNIGAVTAARTASPELILEAVRQAVNDRKHPSGAGFAFSTEPRDLPGPDGTEDAETRAVGDVAAGDSPPGRDESQASLGNGFDPWAHAADPHPGPAPSAKRRGKRAVPGDARSGMLSKITRRHRARPGPTAGAVPEPRLIAVWGPVGSPGRTTLAVNLAAEYALLGRRVVAIDADTYGASMAATLGLLDESASFAQACRVADQGMLTVAELRRICAEVVFDGGSFALLTGLTRPDRWPELRAAAVDQVLQGARSVADVVVVDCGFCLERDEELSYDTVAPRRNAATLSALGQADVIYAVGTGDAIGIPRLIRAMAELPETCAGADIAVVLNKVRKKAAGHAPQRALEQAWARFGPAQPIAHHLPWDAEIIDQALLSGRLLLEIAPESALRRAIRDICCARDQQYSKTPVAKATAER
ncbi:AAA family ATPase [Specibacter sp. RAF43]|uniref:AAA family ATPase n=1 Tax=Specibacter sp. RAF43 TaxID=3233057 RepID=UPI003F94991B